MRKKNDKTYHHGDLAEALLDAVDELARKFGLEAVTLRACAKLAGVAPSAAFRHFADKKALLTAFAARALNKLEAEMVSAKEKALPEDQFLAVGLRYITFSLENPAYFRAMWRSELIYAEDDDFKAASEKLGQHLRQGFADTIADEDAQNLSSQELLAWSSVHGIASLMIDGPLLANKSFEEKTDAAKTMLLVLSPAFSNQEDGEALD